MGPRNAFSFSEDLTCQCYALWACPIAAYTCMSCGHSQSSHYTVCPICPVDISTPCGFTPMATNMPHGHFPFCPVGIPIPIGPVGIPKKRQCAEAPRNAFFFSKDLPCHDMPCRHSQLPFTCPVGIHGPHSFILSLICPVVISMPYGFFLIATHMPRGHSHYAMWAFPTSAYAPWAPTNLPFSAKIYPATICPGGIPNLRLYAGWAFPILTCP